MSPVALIDLGALAQLSQDAGGHVAIQAYPDVAGQLGRLGQAGARLGVVAALPASELRRLLEEAGLADAIDPGLLFEAPVAVAGERCVYVGECRNDRATALSAGLDVAPHLRLALPVLEGAALRYVRVTVPGEHAAANWREPLRELALVPIHVAGENGTVVYAIATEAATSRLDDLGFAVDRLGAAGDPRATEVYLLRDDRARRTGFLSPEGSSATHFDADAELVLSSTSAGLYVALPAGRSVEDFHFTEARHGHTVKLIPDPSLLAPAPARAAARGRRVGADASLSAAERDALATIGAEPIAADLARYTGLEALAAGSDERIDSRHIFHAGNAAAVRQLLQDLPPELSARTHRFTHEGGQLDNVEAVLEGQGDEVIVVGAHLDSTAASSDGYVPGTDPAPGADDNASGTVAVLAVARAIVKLSSGRTPRRSIRFVLFNAEEHGMAGSRAYARDQAQLGAQIVAAYAMDMLGYNRQAPRSWELHAGFWAAQDVEAASIDLADHIARAAALVSPGLPAPQLFRSAGADDRDPAEGRSDHASFHLAGYPACCISEDFFPARTGEAPAEANPNYHMSGDTFVDAEYAADIARAVGAAVWMSANL